MLKHMFAAGAAAGLLAVCAHASFDPATLDPTVRPQDDFFRYADGTWIKNNPIPEEYSRWGAFDELRVRNIEHLHDICVAAAAKGENIADLGGIKIAYAALEKTLSGPPREKVDGFTPEQRFFISYASVWAGSIRPENLRTRVKTDPHSPSEFRVNGPLSNLEEFAAAFDVPEGAPMRRPAADRVTIW